jgi:hypothetical protein
LSRTTFLRGRRRNCATALALLALAFTVVLAGSASATPVTGAAFTTVNEGVDGGGHCQNGNPAVNCNIYDGKQYVWLNGGPNTAQIGAGTYFFAVLAPGGQGGHDNPNDGEPKNLSDVSPTTNTGAGDPWTCRVFSIDSSGVITYPTLAYPATGCAHDFDSNKIRLMPYDDTPNPGGVYIMALCNLANATDLSGANPPGVDPSTCKYDAFKVRPTNEPPPPPNQVESCFSGTKYRDTATTNGQFDDATEVGLSGWTIRLDPGTPGNTSDDLTALTDSSGNWSACEAPHDPAATTQSYTVTETLKSGWRETGNTVDQSIALGGSTVTLNNDFSYTVTVPNDANASADGLNFGNIPQGNVWGAKYYDANLNGIYDPGAGNPGEVLISGWKVSQSGTVFTTGSPISGGAFDGSDANFVRTLDPGSYTFGEITASNWIQTGNTSDQTNTTDQTLTTGDATTSLSNKVYTVVIPNDLPSSVSKVYFGNVCLAGGGGLTLGYWSNQNGQHDMTVGGGGMAANLAFLAGLYLRNAAGTNFDPTTYTQFRTWLLGASATNMAYMLSAQLSAMELNVRLGKVTGTKIVYTPALGFISINNLMSAANTELGLHGLALASPGTGYQYRTYQENLKTALDQANNNLNFVQGSPATCRTPIFPTS